MKVQRCEQIIIKKDHPKFKIIDEMCFNSKNLYKITFNNKKVRNKKYRNKEKEVIINESIFNNKEFKW